MAEKSNEELLDELISASSVALDNDAPDGAWADVERLKAAVLARMAGPGDVVVPLKWRQMQEMPESGLILAVAFDDGTIDDIAILHSRKYEGPDTIVMNQGSGNMTRARFFTHWAPSDFLLAARPNNGGNDGVR